MKDAPDGQRSRNEEATNLLSSSAWSPSEANPAGSLSSRCTLIDTRGSPAVSTSNGAHVQYTARGIEDSGDVLKHSGVSGER